jgi:hypothetical protein
VNPKIETAADMPLSASIYSSPHFGHRIYFVSDCNS